eukprot:CAMPEP_0197876648 /NCGR_PEP_ID=MMETSP1439-20131203/5565_1 /TAXON_ID=66791 /ORGANISM="Gonyaulax spinifera, Strain CCMP409" /LENGTH=145 /DNA_ID=CAMNT_0043495943 /DNA_START=530 /DNA_END=964 /DNA_ORIENTATION=-
MTMLLVLDPLAVVLGAVRVLVDAMAMRHVVQPLTLVDVTADVLETALAPRLVVCPLALVTGAVWPLLDAMAVPQVSEPLAGERGAIAEGVLHTLLGRSTCAFGLALYDIRGRVPQAHTAPHSLAHGGWGPPRAPQALRPSLSRAQ